VSDTTTERGYAAIGCRAITKDANVGGVLRAAHCYGASLICVAGPFTRQASDTTKAFRHIPMLQVDDLMEAVPYDCVPVAVDLLPDASSLIDFVHPQRAFYIFGPENGTLGKNITDKCKHKVFVPTNYCMNLAATVNVILYDRLAKAKRR
jgi:tRNA(Leu) C34 or U34 (ribose-2'-O)-methylase TrmL